MIFEDDDSAVFRFENTVVNLLKTLASRGLIEPGAVAGRETGSRLQLTISVDDTYAVAMEFQARGVVLLSRRMNRPVDCALRASPILAVISGKSIRNCPGYRAHYGLPQRVFGTAAGWCSHDAGISQLRAVRARL